MRRITFRGLQAFVGTVITITTILNIDIAGADSVSERFKQAFSAIQRNDYVGAAEIFRALAEGGNAAAQFNLGNMYLGGNLPKNYSEAAKWLGRAAEQGDPLAQGSLSGLYFEGWGVKQDLVQAYKWAALAHLRRKPIMGGTEEDLARISSNMTPAQISEAQKLVREWSPEPER